MRRVLVVLFLLTTVLIPTGTGTAQEGEPGILLIMDASGSMNREVGSGVTLLDEAKEALREVVLRVPPDTNIGLRVYGHTAANTDAREVGCLDTELIIPVGPIDRDAMTDAIDGFTASGWTPIGRSLQEAVDDLGGSGGTIILVSDGVDTCAPPDPCEVAQQLAEDGYITAIHTVGLALQEQAAADQLQCIADRTGGTFTDVGQVDGLFESLSVVVTDVVEGPPRPVAVGGLTRALAHLLPWDDTVGGTPEDWRQAYVGTSIRSGETRWFAVDVDRPDQQLAANWVIEVDAWWMMEPGDAIEVQIFDADGTPIGVEHEVAGIGIEWPRRLLLADTADWLPAPTNWFPAVVAVTDPGSMFPSWEPDEEFFGPTVERFRHAGLNGGVYHLWKRWNQGEPLAEGRYYVAVTWESAVDGTIGASLGVAMYPMDREGDDTWRDERPHPPVIVDPGSVTAPELLPWSGDRLRSPFETPLRGIEVWSAIEVGEHRRYDVDLAAGEWLVAGWDVELARWESEPGVDVSLFDGDVEVRSTFIPERNGPLLALSGQSFFRAPHDGRYTVDAQLVGDEDMLEPALALVLLVLSDVPEGSEAAGIAIDAVSAGFDAIRRDFG